ncbi:hypothetical protein F5X71_08245 [Nocardia brasiliensis]|uniref:Uncharacterized protein n=1 Tax=Nocardia brasiliensis TaxID=37326 RepID=A0A6G9XN17_NOCBR|nr:hypothetical protein [Nocardia brasiliensis]QIS02315.1 hypothetical protein F5X71_08245 [Nocardia brasiliensis]
MAPQPYNGRTVRVDPDALIDKGKKLAELPSEPNGLFEILTTLNNNLQRLGQPWGDDKLGKQFAEGSEGYLAARESVVGNASTDSDATGAVPIYGQLLVNYGRTIEQAGKAFGLGEDLYAEWILKNYVDEDAKGDPGPYKGPVSSDPNYGKNGDGGGDKGPSAPPPPPPGSHGPGGGPDSKVPGGAPGVGAGGPGPGVGSGPGGGLGDGPKPEMPKPQIGGAPQPPTAGESGATPPHTPDPSLRQGDSSVLSGGPGLPDPSLTPGPLGGVPGVFGPNAVRPIDPVTGLPIDKPGGQGSGSGTGGKGGGLGGALGNPALRSVGAFDGEKLAGKNVPGVNQTRAVAPGTGPMPGMPGGMPSAGAGGGAGDNRDKQRERRKVSPQVDEPADSTDVNDPWQRSGWRTGDR